MSTRGRYIQGNSYYFDDALSPAIGTSLWESCPMLPWLCDPSIMQHYFEDFTAFPKATDTWILTQATTGTGVAGAGPGGVLTIDAGAVTDGQGVNLQLAGIDFLPAAGKHIWFECRVKVSEVTGDLFFGLSEIDSTIVASSDMSTSNHIGFSSFTGDSIMLCDSNNATTRVHTLVGGTLVAATYAKLGFYVNGVTDITFWFNGVPNATKILTADIPVVGLTPSMVVHATGVQTVATVDWIRCAQLR